MKLYLIGMPGCGKSTIGRIIATKLNFEFIDLDSLIEYKSCKFIDEIFNDYGEKFFRDLETNVLKEVMELDDCVISCGGGIVLKPENKDYMNGDVIFLDASLIDLNLRIKESKIERPVLNNKSLEQLYKERINKYNHFATYKIDNKDLNMTIDILISKYSTRS